MDEQKVNAEKAFVETQQGSGSMLAAARKSQNKTIEEIADELNLSVTQIKLIELDQTEGLPEPTYVRGYIRSYAKLLGLKPEEVLSNYLNPDWQKTSSLNEIPKGIGPADHSSSLHSRDLLYMVLPVLVVVLVVGGIVAWYSGTLNRWFSETPQSTRLESVAEPVAASTEPITDEETDAVASDNAPAEVPGGVNENVLVMTFNDTSWVDIRDADDGLLIYKSYAQGEQLEVREAGVLKVFIGNAAGVNVNLNQQPFDLEAYREGVYAKFEIASSQAPAPEPAE